MEFTFADAKRILAAEGFSTSGTDIGQKINDAIQALAGLQGWEFMRRLVRTISTSPVFSLPQGTVALVRACVNGTPASIHPTDYQFLHSGPGDLRKPPHGFVPLRSADIADAGYSPLMRPMPGLSHFCATSPFVTVAKPGDKVRPQPPVTVEGVSDTGARVVARLNVSQCEPAGMPDEKYFDPPLFARVDSVVLDPSTDEPITLHGMTADGLRYVAAQYHPRFKVPKFRLYEIVGHPAPAYDVLAEVRMDPVELVDDTDVLPVRSLEPVKSMLLYSHNLMMNEMQTAEGYRNQAEAWLMKMQVADDTLQAPTVSNTLYEGSAGELSDYYFNL